MDISGISSALGLQKDLTTKQAAQAEAGDFKTTLENALNSKDDTKLKEACDELEAYMLSMVFKQVKQSMLSDDEDSLIPKGDYINMFEGQMIQTIAEKTTEAGGVGISDALYKQMKKTYTAQMQMSGDNQKI